MPLPNTFRGGGYQVTVNADRSINVRPGDWLSKYSMAIYGDFDHIDKFMEKKRGMLQPVPNPDLISVGDILYHPDPLPGEAKAPAGPGVPSGQSPIRARYVADFLRWINQRFLVSDWRVEGTGGGDLSLSFFTAQYETIGVVKKEVSTIAWMHALALGFTIGWPEDICVGGAFSTVQMPDVGTILRAPWHRELELDDFRHGIIVVEFGFNFVYVVGGGNLSLVLFGIGVPAAPVLRAIRSYFRFGNLAMLETQMLKALPSGIMVLAGATIGIPSVGVAGRIGVMYDRHYFGL